MSPKHPKATHFLKSKLFDGLSGFTELEARIRALPTEKERGDAFEVFAEAYFTTQKTAQAKEVWPFDHVPIGVKRRLALDRLAICHSHVAIQKEEVHNPQGRVRP